MKNFSLRKAMAFVLLLNAAWAVSAHANELPFPYSPPGILQQILTGAVTDQHGPLPGVTIAIKGKNVTAITDANGRFSIAAEPGDILVFSFVGYKTAETAVSDFTPLKITLDEDPTTLQEVTVNAGYYNVKEKERTGSISRITAKDIETQPVTNVLAAMQGRMAGVSITQANGTPGSAFDIKIRGQNSLRFGANNPLYVIDGVPYSSEPIGTGINSPVLGGSPNPMNSINPEQIESIEVLKDADATAIYGSRGANGVVLVTTKKGKMGKTQFSAKLTSGLATVTNFMDVMHTEQYLAMRNEAYANGNGVIPANAYDLNTWDQTRYTDWQDKLAGRTAEITNVDASVSGGSSGTQFIAGGNFSRQESVYIKDFAYKKGGFRLNVTHESDNKKFKANFNAGYTVQNNTQPRTDIIREALKVAPNAPALYTDDGSLNWEANTFTNPLRNFEDQYEAKTNDLVAGSLLSYTLLPGLDLKSNIGYSTLSNNETTTIPSTRYNPAQGLGPEQSSLIASRAERKSWIIEPQLNYQRQIGKGILEALVGGTFQSQKGEQYVQYATGFPSNSLIHNLASAADVINMASDHTEYRYQAFFGRVNYNWREKYIVNLTGRRDGSSRFGSGRRYANFGAVGAAWIFSNETLLNGNKILSFGKLRISYGTTGSDQIGDYQYLDTYESSGVSYDGVVGLSPSRLYNPNFAWETNRKFEAALETGFLQDRIFITAGFYDNRSGNQLTGIPLPGTTGFTSLQSNLHATVQNRGVELTLRTVNLKGNGLNWTTSLNLTFSKNKLLEFPGLSSSTYANSYIIGQPLNIRKAYHLLGVDPETGLYTFEDANNDGLINALDKTRALDLNPEYFGGLQNQLRYKGWSLDFLLQFSKQQNLSPELMFGMPGTATNQPTLVSDHWQQPGDVATHQQYAAQNNIPAVIAFSRYTESDGVVVDASYIRLKNISLSYEVPPSLLETVKCRVFVEGQNLLTFTGYKGNDPEFIAIGYLPPMKVLSAGLQFTF